MSSKIVLLSVLMLGAATASAEICVDPDDSDCEATIQAGVDAAGPGETVSVAEGSFSEHVSIDPGKEGLTLKGAGEDETLLQSDGTAIVVSADDVTIRKLTIRGGRTGIELGSSLSVRIKRVSLESIRGAAISGDHSDFTEIEEVTVRNSRTALSMFSNGLDVRESSFTGLSSGLIGSGDDWSVEDNVIERVERHGIQVEGDDAELRSNSIRYVGEAGVEVIGDDAEVEDNSIVGAKLGLFVSGADFSVLRNEVRHTEDAGIEVDCFSCADAVVSDNTLEGAGAPFAMEIATRSDGLEARNNTLSDAYAGGILLDGPGILLSGASVKGCGMTPAPGVELRDEGTVVEDSLVSSCTGDGFLVTDSLNLIRDSEAKKNGEDGFDLADSGGANDLLRNLAKKNIGIGFEVSNGGGNLLEANEASDNRDSFCDEGSGTILVDNDFPTTAAPCAVGD